MENAIDTRKVNRSLFAYRVVDIHNDEFGFAQDNVIYTYVTDSDSKSKGTPWLRMQKTGETGKDRRKYFLFFGDETEYSAIVDKHNDIYDLEHNYVASLVRSKFIIILFLFIAGIILLTGLAMYLGGSMIMNTTSPFSEDKTIHLDDGDDRGGKGSETVDIDIFEPINEQVIDERKAPINDAKNDIDDIKNKPVDIDNLADARQAAIDAIKRAAELAKKAIDETEDLTPAQKRELKARIDDEADSAIKNIEEASTLKEINDARDKGLDEIQDVLDDGIAQAFVNRYCSGDDNDPYDKKDDKITKENANQVISGQREYDNLTNKQREKVNKIIYLPTDPEDKNGYDRGEDTYKNYPEMLRDAKEALREPEAHGSLLPKKAQEYLVWPGAEGRFVFYVQNDGDKFLNYDLLFREANPDNVPLRFKVIVRADTDEYLVGGPGDNWGDSAALNDATRVIEPGEIVQYRIEWQWPDDGTQDARDTEMGISARAQTIQYVLQAEVRFEEIV